MCPKDSIIGHLCSSPDGVQQSCFVPESRPSLISTTVLRLLYNWCVVACRAAHYVDYAHNQRLLQEQCVSSPFATSGELLCVSDAEMRSPHYSKSVVTFYKPLADRREDSEGKP